MIAWQRLNRIKLSQAKFEFAHPFFFIPRVRQRSRTGMYELLEGQAFCRAKRSSMARALSEHSTISTVAEIGAEASVAARH